MDNKDKQIVRLMQESGKRSYADIGSEVGLSITAVKERIKRLKNEGILLDNVYLASPTALGLDLCAFVQVLMPFPEHEQHFVKKMNEVEEVLECHSISGEYSYLLKVRVKNTNQLEQLMSERVTSITGVAQTNSIIALTSYKEITQLKIPE